MDYQYDFRQSYQNRLEEAGVKRFRTSDSLRLKQQEHRRRQNAYHNRPWFASLTNLFRY